MILARSEMLRLTRGSRLWANFPIYAVTLSTLAGRRVGDFAEALGPPALDKFVDALDER